MLKNLKIRRIDKKMTQKLLAVKVGLVQQTISNYEKQGNEPSPSVLRRLAIALDTSSDYLLGLTDDPAPASIKRNYELSESEGIVVSEMRKYPQLNTDEIATKFTAFLRYEASNINSNTNSEDKNH